MKCRTAQAAEIYVGNPPPPPPPPPPHTHVHTRTHTHTIDRSIASQVDSS